MKINTNSNCDIIIYDDTEYPIGCLTYEDSVSLYVILSNTSLGTKILYNKINNHTDTGNSIIQLPALEDGYITVCHIILPTTRRDGSECDCCDEFVRSKDFIRNELIDVILGISPSEALSLEGQSISQKLLVYNPDAPLYYFSDGINFYKEDLQGNVTQVTEQELLDVNASSCNFVKLVQNFFSVCFLRKCYVSLCQKVFNSRAFDKCFDSKVDSSLIYKRDLVWSALNVILYMIDNKLLEEAERLKERLLDCSGLCPTSKCRDFTKQDCGCSK